ncbi:ISL3 family transposase, partial [Megasphaera sp. DISK 18]|uniref:ISL3 family transposase n=1 Tax=Megasphaera sp. DISK 18 TaxID=1776081 RepID=UPI0008070183
RRSQDVIRRIQKACSELISFKTIAKMQGISVSSVIRYFDRLTVPPPKQLPEILSLDEFRGNARGQRYQVAVNNPRTHEILDILPNRNTLEMIHYFSRFPRKERMKVKFVVMDLSPLFRRVVQTMFPYATIIGDRFHIQRLVIWALERVRKKVQNHFREKRIYFKRNKHILNKKGKNLTAEEFDRLHEILKQSPELQRAYALKEAFFKVFSMKEPDSVTHFLTQWLHLVEESGVGEFSSVLKTFKDWRQAILNGLTQVYSNGFTEGMNNKIKVLKRVAFGFRNFERFRARILWTSLRN